jgi:hypothetical protein
VTNANENTDINNFIDKLRWHLPMKYALAMSLDMYQRKLYVGVYRENYSGKKKGIKKNWCVALQKVFYWQNKFVGKSITKI